MLGEASVELTQLSGPLGVHFITTALHLEQELVRFFTYRITPHGIKRRQ